MMLNNNTIIVLAGGLSSRMRSSFSDAQLDPATAEDARTKTKSMILVGDNARPFLDYVLENATKAGYESAILVIGERDDSISDYYTRHQRQIPSLHYVVQRIPPGREKPLGTADALLQALNATPELRGKRVTVCNSDNLYSVDAFRLLRDDAHDNAMIDYDRAALRFTETRIAQFAVTIKNKDGFLSGIIEKPTIAELDRARDSSGRIGVSMNVWRLSVDLILPYLQSIPIHPGRMEKELPVAVGMMVADHPRSVFTIPRSEHVIDLTSPQDIHLVREQLRNSSDV